MAPAGWVYPAMTAKLRPVPLAERFAVLALRPAREQGVALLAVDAGAVVADDQAHAANVFAIQQAERNAGMSQAVSGAVLVAGHIIANA
jgi:hypothetical protein